MGLFHWKLDIESQQGYRIEGIIATRLWASFHYTLFMVATIWPEFQLPALCREIDHMEAQRFVCINAKYATGILWKATLRVCQYVQNCGCDTGYIQLARDECVYHLPHRNTLVVWIIFSRLQSLLLLTFSLSPSILFWLKTILIVCCTDTKVGIIVCLPRWFQNL